MCLWKVDGIGFVVAAGRMVHCNCPSNMEHFVQARMECWACMELHGVVCMFLTPVYRDCSGLDTLEK